MNEIYHHTYKNRGIISCEPLLLHKFLNMKNEEIWKLIRELNHCYYTLHNFFHLISCHSCQQSAVLMFHVVIVNLQIKIYGSVEVHGAKFSSFSTTSKKEKKLILLIILEINVCSFFPTFFLQHTQYLFGKFQLLWENMFVSSHTVSVESSRVSFRAWVYLCDVVETQKKMRTRTWIVPTKPTTVHILFSSMRCVVVVVWHSMSHV